MIRDQIYSVPRKTVSKFSFNEEVATVFPDMIRRSVPGYDLIIDQIRMLTRHYERPHSHYYDLGCSLGAVSAAMGQVLTAKGCRIIAVDNSAAMINKCRQQLDKINTPAKFHLICSGIEDINIQRAQMVVLNFTLQFIDPSRREHLLKKIHQGLLPGGLMILSEKIKASTGETQDLYTEWHHAFKKYQGYSDLEISQKRTALEQVLVADTLQTHLKRLYSCGFSQVEPWFQCFNFISILALK